MKSRDREFHSDLRIAIAKWGELPVVAKKGTSRDESAIRVFPSAR